MDIDIVNSAIAFIAGFLSALAGGLLVAWLQKLPRKQDYGALLPGERDHMYLVYPPRNFPAPETMKRPPLLPDISAEDDNAMANIFEMASGADWPRNRLHRRDHTRLDDSEKEQNLVIICSPKRNDIAREFLDKLREQGRLDVTFEVYDDERWKFVCNGKPFTSDSYDQEDELRQGGKDVALGPLDDCALIIKACNPWPDEDNPAEVLFIAGIRGIGTWGAAKHLRTYAKSIYKKVGDKEFYMIVNIRYEKWRIKRTKKERLLRLPEVP